MQKMQILFPEPLMERMKRVAARLDMPVSEVVRRATERWLERFPEEEPGRTGVPVIDAGRCLLPAERFREAVYDE